MTGSAGRFLILIIVLSAGSACDNTESVQFNPEKDLISLHYDHAPDKDDGQSAAADRTVLESLYGKEWIRQHVVAVSGAYGENAAQFDSGSNAVMDKAWNDCGGWLPAHTDRETALTLLTARWISVILAGGDVWVKEGGQSDLTADAVREIRQRAPDINTLKRIHVVQHSDWNEEQTTDSALEFTKQQTDYIRIRDANNYLNIKGGDRRFEQDAATHPVFGQIWQAAFEYYDPAERLDFSDTGELMRILGLGELNVEQFRLKFLAGK